MPVQVHWQLQPLRSIKGALAPCLRGDMVIYLDGPTGDIRTAYSEEEAKRWEDEDGYIRIDYEKRWGKPKRKRRTKKQIEAENVD